MLLEEECPGLGGFVVAAPLCPDASPRSGFADADGTVTGARSGVPPSRVSREDCLVSYADAPPVALPCGLSAFGAGVGRGATGRDWLAAFAESLCEKRDSVTLIPSAFPDETTCEGGAVEDAPGFASEFPPLPDGETDAGRFSVPFTRSRSRDALSGVVPEFTRGVTPPADASVEESGAAGRPVKRVPLGAEAVSLPKLFEVSPLAGGAEPTFEETERLVKRVSPESEFVFLPGEVPPPVVVGIAEAGTTLADAERLLKRVSAELASVSFPATAPFEVPPAGVTDAGTTVEEAARLVKRVSPESAFAFLPGEIPPPVGVDIEEAGMTFAGEERFVKRVLSALESVSSLSALLETTPLAGAGV